MMLYNIDQHDMIGKRVETGAGKSGACMYHCIAVNGNASAKM